MALITSAPSITGTAISDIIFVDVSGPGIIDGGDGDDVIIDNYGKVITSHGTNFATALDLDADDTFWYDSSVRENAFVFDDHVPHLTIYVAPRETTQVYFQISVAAGKILTVDVEAALRSLGTDSDTALRLYFSLEAVSLTPIASSHVVPPPASEGYGSVDQSEAFLDYTNATG